MIKPKDNHWEYLLQGIFESAEFMALEQNIDKARRHAKPIFPQAWNVFRALDLCPLSSTKVVILGQDPYHAPKLADGLAFSVGSNQKIPPSLKNIFRALKSDLRIDNTVGNLDYWAVQGVLLLNTILTVEQGKPLSHKNKGWEAVTDHIIRQLDLVDRPIVFMLWGKEAQSKKHLINNNQHLILETSHPSPLSAHQGFLFCKHFSKANKYLRKHGMSEIDWRTR